VSEAATPPADLAAPSGERRQVTVLFADMVGFTAISERLGEEGTFALIQPIYELMAGAVKEKGGSVKDFTGDGIMALFGVPEALEDAPLRACRAGLQIHERLAAAAPAIEAKHSVSAPDAHRHQLRACGGHSDLVGLVRRPASRASQQLSAPATRRPGGDVVIVGLFGD